MNMSLQQDDTNTAFCHGSGMIMYMDGFHITLRGGHSCLNLLFEQWTLNARWKVIFAIMVTYCFAVAVEGLAKMRHIVVATSRNKQNTIYKHWARSTIPILHGTQAMSGYLLMLVSMTFSLELFVAVVLGLTTGYGYFFVFSSSEDSYQLQQHVTTNPCCEFMEEESKETAMNMSSRDDSTLMQTGAECVAADGECRNTV